MATRVAALAAVAVLVGTLPAAVAAASSPRDEQWGLERIRAPEAWERTHGQGTVVAVVDTGVDPHHPDLADRLLRDADGRVLGRDVVDDDDDPWDRHGHGTLVAGVAAAASDQGVGGPGVAGVAPRARIMPVRVLDEEGRGRVSDVDEGIRWAADNGADVINLSLEDAVPVSGDVLAKGLDDAIAYAWSRGAVVVAAAGNTGTPFTDYRSDTPVLLVGATDTNDRRALFSDAGRDDMVFAPGVEIVSTWCERPCDRGADRGYALSDGTSFAAPHVAAAIALLRAAGADHQRAVSRLRETAEPVRGGSTDMPSGHGRIDAAAALDLGAGDGGREQADPGPSAGEPEAGPDATGQEASDAQRSDRPDEPAAEPRDGDDARDERQPRSREPTGTRERGDDGDEVELSQRPPRGGGPAIGVPEVVAAGVVATSLAAVLAAGRRLDR